MGLTRAELTKLRAVVRTANGLPDPPARPEPVGFAPERRPGNGAEPAASSPAAPARAAPSPRPETDGAEGAWRPDEAVHRLVELLIGMRALSQGAPASPLDPSRGRLAA